MKFGNNRMLRIVLVIYIVILIMACTLTCGFYYQNRKNAHLASMNNTLIYLVAEYKNLTENFWKYYLPVFSEKDTSYTVLDSYFSAPGNRALSPMEKQQLMHVLSRLTVHADAIRWVALYAPERSVNYIYYVGTGRLEELTESFPFQEELRESGAHMKVYGSKPVWLLDHTEQTFAIAGGAPSAKANGRLLFGFDTQSFDNIVKQNETVFESLTYQIAENDSLVYYNGTAENEVIAGSREIKTVTLESGKRMFIQPLAESPRRSVCYFTVDKSELFRISCAGIGNLIALLMVFVLVTIVLFVLIIELVNREVAVISGGLARIGENHLDYRFDLNFRNDGFNDIALAINKMAERLQRTVEQSYQFELKQRDHEMAELMAKFNPHFLYNTLELFRSRCERNGDDDTAGLIQHMATIFRSLIGSRHIISIREELAFSQHYLKLFRARYGDRMKIVYDFPTEILDCLIIRNVLQPLIENYFEHGFNAQRIDNYLHLRGEIAAGNAIRITVEDNGYGIKDEALKRLQEHIASPETHEGESYGLKNLNQRIRLYYGDGYGVSVSRNEANGMTVTMLVAYSK